MVLYGSYVCVCVCAKFPRGLKVCERLTYLRVPFVVDCVKLFVILSQKKKTNPFMPFSKHLYKVPLLWCHHLGVISRSYFGRQE